MSALHSRLCGNAHDAAFARGPRQDFRVRRRRQIGLLGSDDVHAAVPQLERYGAADAFIGEEFGQLAESVGAGAGEQSLLEAVGVFGFV